MRTPAIHRDTTIRCSPEAVATEVNQEIVLMSLERNRCYGLDSTGSDIWRKLASPISVSELIAQLKGEYDDSSDQIETDVLRTLRELAAEGLIVVSPAAEQT